jgi:hypothetical protein
MIEAKRCCGYKGEWGCVEDYPDHIVPLEQFHYTRATSDGLQGMCKGCIKLKDSIRTPIRQAIISRALKLSGHTQREFRSMTGAARREILDKVDSNNREEDITHRFKSEFGKSTPMTKRETTVVEGEQVPEGWVYVVYNPDVPSVLKIGKTFPDGIPSIMSSARRFGRAELADKFWFSEAYKAEQAIHTVLSDCNLRSLGYSDCGVELFKCNLNDVRGAVENAIR